MIAADFEIVRQFFPSSKWVNEGTKNHKEALMRLANYDVVIAKDALISMKACFARTFITAEELVMEIKSLEKRMRTLKKQQVTQFSSEEVKNDYERSVQQLEKAPRLDIQEAVGYGRSVGLLRRDALDPDIRSWNPWTVGIVTAIVQKLNS